VTSDFNIERIRGAMEAFNRRDFDEALEIAADDFTWQAFLAQTETPLLRGKEAIKEAWTNQVETLDLKVEPQQVEPVGELSVVVTAELVAHGTGSRIRLTQPIVWLWTFNQEGLGKSIEVFESRDEAVATAERRPAGEG
jgi:ketosteroid isomerase-like protein